MEHIIVLFILALCFFSFFYFFHRKLVGIKGFFPQQLFFVLRKKRP